MRQTHRGGRRPSSTTQARSSQIVDLMTGEVTDVELFRDGARREQLHLRGRRRARSACGTSRGVERPRLRLLPLHARDPRARSASKRGEWPASLRARHQRDLPRDGAALRHGRDPRPPAQAERQGEGRRRRTDRTTVDPRLSAQPHVLQPRGAQRRNRRAAREAQHASVSEARGCRQAPPSRAIDRPAMQVRCRATRYVLAEWKGRRSTSTITSPTTNGFTACRTRWSARQVEVRATAMTVEILHRRRARRGASSVVRTEGNGDDARGAPTEVAPGLRRVAALANHLLGSDRRTGDGVRRRAHPRRSAAPGAGIPILPRPDPHPRSSTAGVAHGGGVCARDGDR